MFEHISSKPRSFRRFALFAALAGLIASPAAAADQRQQMVYEVYAGGIHAMQASMDMDLRKKGRYDMVLDAKTRGFLATLVPWEGRFESHGWEVKEGDFRPEQHKSTASWRKELDIKDYRYKQDGKFVSLEVFDEKGKVEDREIDAEVTDGTVDTMTATLAVLDAYNKTGKCEGSSEVFDGKRRFKQAFVDKGEVELEPSKYNIYGGKARECTVEITPINGKWSEKPRGWLSIQEQGRKKGTMPTVWIAQVTPGQPAVAVKIRVKTDYGTLFMHLAEYKSGDNIVVAQERSGE